MKKFLAVVLAVAMVLSLGAVAFAEESTASTKIGTNNKQGNITAGNTIYKYDEDAETAFTSTDEVTGDEVPYGETLYIPLYYKVNESTGSGSVAQVTSADAVSGLKLSTKWDENGEYVEGVEIVKKEGAYYIAIETTGSSMDDNDVEGTITIKGKDYKYGDTSDDKKTKLDAEIEVNVVITLAYTEVKTSNEITKDPQIFVFDDDASTIADEEQDFTTKEADDVTFTVDTTHQTDIVLSFNSDAIDEVEDNYPAANLDFYVFNGATFKKTGELFIPADEGTYFYEIVDDKAVEVDAEYDDYDEGYYLKTKTLGVYVVSDVKLATATAAESTTTDAATTNPTTGAAL